MKYDELKNELLSLDRKTLGYLISDMLFNNKIDITDINEIYVNRLKDEVHKKDMIIKEADNCIFKSLFYDHLNKTDSSNVILEKVRWRYKYADTNKRELCKMFNYDPEKDKEDEK